MKIHSKVLNMMTGKDPYRVWINSPFQEGDVAIATDSKMLVAIPLSLTEGAPERHETAPAEVLSIFPAATMFGRYVLASDIAEILSKHEKEQDEIECEVCEGEGVFFADDTDDDEDGVTCCECGGLGGTPIDSYSHTALKYLRIGGHYFSLYYMEKLLNAAALLDATELHLLAQVKNNGASLFFFSECRFLVMPCAVNVCDEVVGEIVIRIRS